MCVCPHVGNSLPDNIIMQFCIFRYDVETGAKVECFQETGVQSRRSAEMEESLRASNDVQ